MAESNPLFLTNLCVVAADFRRLTAGIVCTEGVAGPFPYAPGSTATSQSSFYTGSLAVTTGSSGLDLSVLAGSAYIDGDDAADQGMYWVENDAPATLTVGAADPTNPRIDIVVATVRDSDYGGANDDWILQVVAGTATVGATLSNLTGAPAVPTDSIRLAYVLVPAAFVGPFVNATHIKDARTPYGMCEGGLPRLTLTIGGAGGELSPFNFAKANYPWLKSVRVRVWGGGGGGGGGNGGVASASAKGAGGGGGGYAEAIIDVDRLAAVEVCTAGAAGSAGSATGGNGGTGGDSTFGAWMTGGGGGGGNGMTPATTGNNGAAGGAGGVGLGGTGVLTMQGGDGQGGYVHTGFGNRPNGGPAAAGGGGGRGGDGASSARVGADPGGGGGGGGSSTGNAGQTGATGGIGAICLELFG